MSIAGFALLDETVYSLLAKQLRDSGLPADVVVGKLKKDRQAGRQAQAGGHAGRQAVAREVVLPASYGLSPPPPSEVVRS
jgi:hypothetical protein